MILLILMIPLYIYDDGDDYHHCFCCSAVMATVSMVTLGIRRRPWHRLRMHDATNNCIGIWYVLSKLWGAKSPKQKPQTLNPKPATLKKKKKTKP